MIYFISVIRIYKCNYFIHIFWVGSTSTDYPTPLWFDSFLEYREGDEFKLIFFEHFEILKLRI